MATPAYGDGVRVAGPLKSDLFSIAGGTSGVALNITTIAIPSTPTHDVTKVGNWSTAGVASGMLVEGANILPNTYVDSLSTTTMTLTRKPTNTTGSNVTNASMTFHKTAGGGLSTTAKMSGVEFAAGSNMTITPSASTAGRPIYTIASTASGSGDVSAGTSFNTAGVLMAASGGGAKEIDVPGTTLTTNSQGLTVGGALAATTGTFSSTLEATTGTFSGVLKTDSTAAATSITDGALQTDGGLSVTFDAVIGDDIIMISDGAIMHFGVDSDVSLTHYADNGLLLNSTMKLYFEDGTNYDQYIGSAGSGITAIAAPTEIDLTAPTLDINAITEVNVDTPSFVLTSSTSDKPDMVIKNTNDDATGPSLTFTLDTSTSAGTNDVAGTISFNADDAGNVQTEYGRIQVKSAAVTAGSEQGQMLLGVATTDSGAYADIITITGGADAAASTVVVKGNLQVDGETTTVNSTTVTIDDLTFNMAADITTSSSLNGAGIVLGAANYASGSSWSAAPTLLYDHTGTRWEFSAHDVQLTSTTASTSSTTGALIVDGGAGIAGDLYVGDDLRLRSNASVFAMGLDADDFSITHDGDLGATIAGAPITITAAEASTWSTSSGALTLTSAAAATWSTAAGALTITSAAALELDGSTITLDSAGDIELNAAGNDINLLSGATAFGSFTNNSGVLQIKSATDKELEIRSERDMTFIIDDDAGDTSSFFTFQTEDTTGTSLTGVDGELAPVITKYISGSTTLGRTEYGKVVQDGAAGTNNTLFTYDSSVFSACEILIHTKQGEAVLSDGLHQVNKMIVCAASMEGGGTDTVTFSNYSIIYSDGSTELASFTATISSDTVSVQFDATDNDVITYAVTFLA